MKFLWILLFSSLALADSWYVNNPTFGDLHWKAPVANVSLLGTTGNLTGDARVSEDTFSIYVWTGSAWQAISGGGGSGDVTGPGSAVANDIVVFNGTTGKLISDSGTKINALLSTSLLSGDVFIGNGSNIATGVALSGDISITPQGTTAYVGILPINKGGTGQTTASSALGALLPDQTSASGKFLQSNGTPGGESWQTAGGGSITNSVISADYVGVIEDENDPTTISGFTSTPAAGDYLVTFDGLLQGGTSGGSVQTGIYYGSAYQTGTLKYAVTADESGSASLGANQTFYADFNDNSPDATNSVGSATGTLNGAAVIHGGVLDSRDPTIIFQHGGVSYDAVGNADSVNTFAARFHYIPNYNVGPDGAQITLFEVTNGPFAGENKIHLFQQSSSNLELILNDKDGNNIVFDGLGSFSTQKGRRYEIELDLDAASGDYYVFIDGVLLHHGTPGAYTRDSNINYFGIQRPDSDALPSDGVVDDFSVFSTVQHTTNYTPAILNLDAGEYKPVSGHCKITVDGSTPVSVKWKSQGITNLVSGSLSLIKL